MSKKIMVIIPVLESEMKEIDKLSQDTKSIIINSTVKSTLEQTGQDIHSIEVVHVQFLVRKDPHDKKKI